MDKLTRQNQQIAFDAQIANANRARELAEEAERNLTPKERAKREERKLEEKQRVDEITAKVEKEKQQALEIVNSFFDSNEDEFNQFIDETHNLEESPIRDIVEGGDPHSHTGPLQCKLCEDSNILLFKIPDHRDKFHWSKNAHVVHQIEEHCKHIEPEEHKQEILRIINSKYSDMLYEALREKKQTFEQELATIEAYHSSPPGFAQVRKKPPKAKTKEERLRDFDNSL